MHSIFNFVSTTNQGIIKFPEWSWVRDGLKRNLGTVISYYRNNPMAVDSSHFLVRLLTSITVPQSQHLERYYDNVDAIALNVSMALKMTSSIYRGSIFKGTFYGPGSSEILIATNVDFDPHFAHKHWQNLAPVQILRHPRSDLGLNLPNGKDTGTEEGLAVIAINIPMLAVQYRAFRFNELYLSKGTDSQKSIMQFIHMYVLPNALVSQTDLAVFNRIDNLSKGAPIGESTKAHPFFLPETYDTKAVSIQKDILATLEKVGKDFVGIMRSIPLTTKETTEELFRLPPLAPTRQVDWALTIARLPMLSFLFRVSKDNVAIRDQRQVNAIARSVLQYRSGNIMHQALPRELFYDVQNDIDDIMQIANPKYSRVFTKE